MPLIKRLTRLSATLLLVVGGLVIVAAAPAQADTSCPAGSFCVWSGANYTGARYIMPTGWDCVNTPFEVYSAKNRSPNTWVADQSVDCTGTGDTDVISPLMNYPLGGIWTPSWESFLRLV